MSTSRKGFVKVEAKINFRCGTVAELLAAIEETAGDLLDVQVEVDQYDGYIALYGYRPQTPRERAVSERRAAAARKAAAAKKDKREKHEREEFQRLLRKYGQKAQP